MDSLGCQPFKGVIWALVLGLYLGDVIKGLLVVLGPFLISFWACVLDLRTYYFKPHQTYTKLMFTCYLKYNINLGDKDFDNSLTLYFKFLRKNFMKEDNNIMTMYYSALYTLSSSNYGRIYQDKPFIEINNKCKEIVEIMEPQKLDRIEIPTIYVSSLEDDILEEDYIQIIYLPIFRGNSLIVNNSINNTRRRSFQRLREKVHSPLLLKENYYNGERDVEETKILIDKK